MTDTTEIFYTYVYYDGNIPIYVGKGKSARAFDHLDGCKHNRFFNFKLQKMKRDGRSPRVEITKTETEFAAFRLEEQLIKKYGRRDLKKGSLLNLTDGGEGPAGRIKTKAELAKLSLAAKNMTVEQRLKQSIAQTGTKRSTETKLRMSAAQKLRTATVETKIIQSLIAKSRPIVSCPHCAKQGTLNGMKQWHFDRCKSK